MNLGLEDRHVLVVGGSRGIGQATAEAFADEGCQVTVVGSDGERVREVAERLRGRKSRHAGLSADLLMEGQPTRTAREIIETRGAPDIVVHAVGGSVIRRPNGIIEVRDPLAPVEDWRLFWQFNAGIAIEMNAVLIRPMREKGWGRVIHVSSISGVMLRGAAPYAAAKAYLNAYTKTLGRALAPEGIVVSALLPGAVAFEGSYWDQQIKDGSPRVDDFLRHHQAVGRMGTPKEIASFAVLLGSELATFAQGALVPVDGGNM